MSDILTVNEASLTAIADEIRKKTGKKDKIKFPAGFVSEIDSIQTGGGSAPAEEIKEKDVNFFDYDGTLIASYTETEAKALTSLPTPPVHSGLVFQGWNYTLEEVITNAEMADIGALYTTDDGATRLEIEIASESRKTIQINFSQNKAAGVLIDWGDGESERSYNVADTTASATHEYGAAGHYTITLTVDDDCEIALGKYSGGIIPTIGTSGCVYQSELLAVHIGNGVTKLNNGAFKRCYQLTKISISKSLTAIAEECFYPSGIRYITIPAGIDTINYDTFDGCNALKNISLPPSVQTIGQNAFRDCFSLERIDLKNVNNPGDYAFYDCYSLTEAVINADVTYLPGSLFNQCRSLVDVEFLGKVKMIYSNLLYGCGSLKKVDFTHCTAVPTAQSNIFYGYPSDMEILVPADLVDEWKAATNWTTYASKIKGV